MTGSDSKQAGIRICFCYGINDDEIRDAIRQGCCTLEDIRSKTKANTGCGGCLEEVLKILQAELPQVKAMKNGVPKK